MNRRAQLEEALRNAGAGDQIDIINEKIAQMQHHLQQQQQQQTPQAKPPTPNQMASVHQSPLPPPQQQQAMLHPPTPERIPQDRIKQELDEVPQQYVTARDMREPPPPPPMAQENKGWGYSGLDLMNSGAAFWQNYSESLAQELEMERKSRQQQAEREVKSPLQDRSGYYKNSVMFTSSAT